MNRLTTAISEICRERLLDEKRLLAPSLSVGHQWLESVVRSGQPAVNCRVLTLKGLAIDLASPAVAERGVVLLTQSAGALVVDSIWRHLPRQGYLWQLKRSSALCQSVFATLQTIRIAGLTSADLRAEHFEVAAKADELNALLQTYEQQLQTRRLIDDAELFRMAIDRLERDAAALPEDVLLLVPEDLQMRGLQQSLLSAVASARVIRLPVDPAQATADGTDRSRLGWLLQPDQSPLPAGDGTVRFFRAIGEANEVREVLRRCVAGGCRLDDVEVLYTSAETYVPLFYEQAQRMRSGEDFLADGCFDDGLPVSFADGIPATYSRPGRALMAWLAWIDSGYPQQELARMIHDGLIEMDKEREFSNASLAAMFRSVGIGLGRDRYLTKLKEQIAALSKQIASSQTPPSSDEETRDAERIAGLQRLNARGIGCQPKQARDAERIAGLQRRRRGMRLLRRRIRKLIAISPPPADDARLLNSATEFLQQLAPCSSEMDHVARKSLLEEIQQMKLWSELTAGDLSTNLRAWLAALPRQVRVLRSGPRPGRLHVAHVLSGGHSGRPNTFVIGLDDSRFPGAALQDPMLLDSERTRISALLPATTSETAERLRVLAGLFARLRGMVTLGYSCCDLVDDRELFPSPVVWAAFRIISGNHDGNHSDLLHWLEPAASFAPDAVEKSLHGTEWWLWRLCTDGPVANALEAVAKQFPHLRRGLAAQLARSSHAVSCFDGHVPAAGAAMDPTLADGPVLSASALETIGRCPLAYFFGYGLGVRPPDELQLDPDRWLDPLSFGSLLHEVFRQFMTGLSAAGRLPVFDRDQQQLAAILNEQIQHYRDLVPPPSETAFRQQCRLLHRTARIFLRSEAAFCRTSQPQYFEVSLGLPSDALSAPPALPAGGLKPPLDDPQPIQVFLPGGTSIRACGRIDRIDLIGGDAPNQFSVWDYKTGSSSRYQAGDPFRQGRIIQNALYVAIAQAALRRAIGTQATVDLFGYFFPSLRSWGTRITWTADQLTEGKRIIQRLCQIVAGGTFLPTDNRDDCMFCDHQSVCGDLVAVTQASKLKLVNHENIMLQAIKELRGYVD